MWSSIPWPVDHKSLKIISKMICIVFASNVALHTTIFQLSYQVLHLTHYARYSDPFVGCTCRAELKVLTPIGESFVRGAVHSTSTGQESKDK